MLVLGWLMDFPRINSADIHRMTGSLSRIVPDDGICKSEFRARTPGRSYRG